MDNGGLRLALQKTRFAFSMTATLRNRRGFTPRPFPIRPLPLCIAPSEIFRREGREVYCTVRLVDRFESSMPGAQQCGPAFRHNEAFSFQVTTAGQTETDRY